MPIAATPRATPHHVASVPAQADAPLSPRRSYNREHVDYSKLSDSAAPQDETAADSAAAPDARPAAPHAIMTTSDWMLSRRVKFESHGDRTGADAS
eukprot:4992576-Prymnesium_polylepis.1